jgi:ubiquitin-activating enzyme E1 C
MLNKPTAFPICTIANTPRLPEHCIEWASVLEWPRVQGGLIQLKFLLKMTHLPCADKKMDTDDPEHIGWLYKVAAARAAEFKIEGVTWSLTQGVVKNIIPAIASTNAIIAGLYHFLTLILSCTLTSSFIHMYSCLLQRSIQDCYQLCSLP